MHIPVLLGETIESLQLKEGMTVVDATLGDGGHAREVIKRIGFQGTFIGFDLDDQAIQQFVQYPEYKEAHCYLINENFAHIKQKLDELGIEKVDAIMADLGWRTPQIEDPLYGLSFQKEGPLDMRLGNRSGELTAREIINTWPEDRLTEIFRTYGEERYAMVAARAIVQKRKQAPIETTTQLAKIIDGAIGSRYRRAQHGHQRINPATRIFQALRIVVNQEMENIEKFLPQALSVLKAGGRMAIITFHSLEDRIVKQFFKANAGGCVCPKELPICVCGKNPLLRLVTKKPVIAGSEEIQNNPRSRSAKLRVIEKV